MKIINYLSSSKLFVLLAVVTLVPFVLLSFFNNPATDDFYYAYHSKTSGLLNAPWWMYNNLGGRYFSNTLLSFNSVYFNNYYWFKILSITLIIVFTFSVYYFISSLFNTVSKSQKNAITGLVVLLFFIQLPDACSAFYWMPGAITNQLPISLSLLFYATLIKFYKTKKIKFLLISIVLLIFSMGCNEITVVLTLLLLYFVLFQKSLLLKKIDYTLIFIVIVATLFAAIEILAPGNAVRAKEIPVSHDVAFSIAKSLLSSIVFFLKWSPLVALFSLFFSESINEFATAENNKNYLVSPIYSVLIVFGILFFGLFPGFYVNRNLLPDRTLNNLYFYFFVALLYMIMCVLFYLKNKYNYELSISNSSKTFLGIIIALSVFSNTPIYNAYHDLLTGKAYQYNKEMESRFELISNSKENKVLIPALKNQPKTIFQPIIMGITTDLKDWRNAETSEYFEKEIVVKPTDSTFTE